jgi:hypothetical protein
VGINKLDLNRLLESAAVQSEVAQPEPSSSPPAPASP